jgi:hypothetical protein
MAQDKSTTQVTPGTPTVTTQVERAEVVYVSGNDLVVKMENGEVRHLSVPDSARATVDGKEVTIRDLKPGMKLERTITTTTTPRTVTTVRTITGRVVQVMPPLNVILALPDGQNRRYQIPKDQVFMIDGEKKTAFDLRPGMSVTATVVTQAPEVVSSEQRVVTGRAPAPPPPATPPPQSVLLIEVPAPSPVAAAPPAAPAPAPAPQAAEPAPVQLPKTASPAPLAGLIGLLLVTASLGVRALRHRV